MQNITILYQDRKTLGDLQFEAKGRQCISFEDVIAQVSVYGDLVSQSCSLTIDNSMRGPERRLAYMLAKSILQDHRKQNSRHKFSESHG